MSVCLRGFLVLGCPGVPYRFSAKPSKPCLNVTSMRQYTRSYNMVHILFCIDAHTSQLAKQAMFAATATSVGNWQPRFHSMLRLERKGKIATQTHTQIQVASCKLMLNEPKVVRSLPSSLWRIPAFPSSHFTIHMASESLL